MVRPSRTPALNGGSGDDGGGGSEFSGTMTVKLGPVTSRYGGTVRIEEADEAARRAVQLARVVKPGGRVLMIAYGDPHEIEFLGAFVTAVQTVVPAFEGPPMDPLPLPFQLHDPERLRDELVRAGLTHAAVETISEPTEYTSGAHLWDWLVHSNPIVGAILAELDLDADETVAVREALERIVRERAGGSGPATLTAPINIGIATK